MANDYQLQLPSGSFGGNENGGGYSFGGIDFGEAAADFGNEVLGILGDTGTSWLQGRLNGTDSDAAAVRGGTVPVSAGPVRPWSQRPAPIGNMTNGDLAKVLAAIALVLGVVLVVAK